MSLADTDPLTARPGTAPLDVIPRLRAKADNGSDAERRLADCILADIDFASRSPIADLAARAQVSEPTVSRLARALGFDGTRDLKFHLAQALAIGGAYLRSDGGTLLLGESQTAAAICAGACAAVDLVRDAYVGVDTAAPARILAESNRILIYGTGGSSSMAAVELENRLFRLGLNAKAHIDPQLQRMSAAVVDGRAVVVAFSLSGRVRSVMDAVKVARTYGAKVIAVTGAGSPLAHLADLVMPVVFREDGNLYKPSSSRYGLLAVVDILAMATAETIGPDVLENLRRIKQSLALHHASDPTLPLGD